MRYASWRICLIVSDYVCMCLVLFIVNKILDSGELLSSLLEMGVEYYLVCIIEGLLCGKGVEPPRGRGRLRGVRETQLFLRSNQSNRVDYADFITCGHKLQWGQDVPGYFFFFWSVNRYLVLLKVSPDVVDIGVVCCLFVVCVYMFGWLCWATYCSIVSTSMLGASHAVQNEKKL